MSQRDMKTRMKTFDVWFTDVDRDGKVIDFTVEAPTMWIDIEGITREEWLDFKQAVNIYVKGTFEFHIHSFLVNIIDNGKKGHISLSFWHPADSMCSIDFTLEEWALLKKRINAFTDTLPLPLDEAHALKGLKEPKDRV